MQSFEQLAPSDDFEAQEPLVHDEIPSQHRGRSLAVKVGVGVSGLVVVAVALASFSGMSPKVSHSVREVTVLQAELDDSAEEILDEAEDANHLNKDMLDDMPIYTDQTGPNQRGAGKPKHWEIRFSDDSSEMEFDDRKKLAEEVFGDKLAYIGQNVPMLNVVCTHAELRQMLSGNHDHFDMAEQDVKNYIIPLLPPSNGDDRRLSQQANPPSWGLGRIDERDTKRPGYSPIDSSNDGRGVHVYVMDTGVRTTHRDFEGRAIPTLEVLGNTPRVCRAADTNCAKDNGGHGTHCAGTVAGSTYGVAKKSIVHAVKILGDDGSGSFQWFHEGIDWIIGNQQKPAVISASLGGGGQFQSTQTWIDAAVNKGVVVVVAAGNENDQACSYTPAYVPSAITVGSTTEQDGRSSFSNKGNCVDLFAPGSNIVSAGVHSNAASDTMSGTSMACPHVAGAVALTLSADPSMSARAVSDRLKQRATDDVVHDLGGAPNLLLYVGDGDDETTRPPAPPPPPPADGGGGDWDCASDGWKVTKGNCEIDAKCCLTSPGFPSRYRADQECRVQVGRKPDKIVQDVFKTEGHWDILTVPSADGVGQYSGDDGPHDVIPTGELVWSSDYSVQAVGFKLCLQEMGDCPANGWMLQPGCVQHWTYDGEVVDGCSTKDHTGGWCIKKHEVHNHFYWTDCIKCS